MSRNKLPKSEKKVLLMSVYVLPKLKNNKTKQKVNELINQLQEECKKSRDEK